MIRRLANPLPDLKPGPAAENSRFLKGTGYLAAASFSPGLHNLLNSNGISSLHENWALYQGTTLVGP
jgi:hypothetical protein